MLARPFAIGIDLGGSQIRAALLDRSGRVLERRAAPTPASAGPDVVIDKIIALADAVSAGVARDQIVGMGVAAPGPLDTVSGMALSTPTLAGFTNLPLTDMLRARTDLPVCLENDGIAAALGEWRFGAGQGYDNLVYITVSTGIGGGIICDGRILRGRFGMAGHIGHMTIARDGALCACGNRGCWEAYGSGPALARRAEAQAAQHRESALHGLCGRIDGRAIFAAAAAGDALALALVAEEADVLGIGITNLLHLYSPQIVLLGGGIANGFDVLEPGIRARVQASAMQPFRGVPIRRAGLHDNSGLVGAAALAFDTAASNNHQQFSIGIGT